MPDIKSKLRIRCPNECFLMEAKAPSRQVIKRILTNETNQPSVCPYCDTLVDQDWFQLDIGDGGEV